MTASTVYLVHDDRDESGGECVPRISLDCAACGESVVYCHLSSDVLRAYVNPKTQPWRCDDCRHASWCPAPVNPEMPCACDFDGVAT